MTEVRQSRRSSGAVSGLLLLGAIGGGLAAFLAPDGLQVAGLLLAGVCAAGAAGVLHHGDLVGRALTGLAGLAMMFVLVVAVGAGTPMVEPAIYHRVAGSEVYVTVEGLCVASTTALDGGGSSGGAPSLEYTCPATWDWKMRGTVDLTSADMPAGSREFSVYAFAVGERASTQSRVPDHPVWLPFFVTFPWILATPVLGIAFAAYRAARRRTAQH